MMSDSDTLLPPDSPALFDQADLDSAGFSAQPGPTPAPPPTSNADRSDPDPESNDATQEAPRPDPLSSTPAQPTASLSTGPLPDYSTLSIVDALKSSDNTGKTFIVYLIRCGTHDAKRRYSEFESLREALVRLFPCSIVPPIPGKHTLGDYATKPSTAKEDGSIIGRRRRMLGSFLRRCAGHAVLNRSIVFQRFLDGRFSWHDITSTPPLSLLPKSNLRGPASDPTSTPSPSSLAAYATAPLPAPNAQPREPNKRFLDSEAFTDRMTESGSLALAIERVGQAADTSYLGAGQLMQEWEQAFTEPLQEYVQFAAILQKALRWRTAKHVQYELALDTLEIKRAQLDEYERVEREALRFDAALASGGRGIVERSTYAGGAGAGSGGRTVSGSGGAGAGSLGRQHQGYGHSEDEHAHWGRAAAPAPASNMRRSLYGAAAEDDDVVDHHVQQQQAHPPPSYPRILDNNGGGGNQSMSSSEATRSTDSSSTAPGAVDLFRSSSQATARSSSSHPSGGNRVPGQARHRGAGNTTGPGGGGSGGILGALTHTFASMMDTNPAGTRMANVAKLRDTVILLEEAVDLLRADLDFATQTIQADLDRFQRQKVVDFKEMMIAFAKMHRELCRQNLESWQAAKAEIARIDTESAMPNSSLTKKERDEDGDGDGDTTVDSRAPALPGGFSAAGLEDEGGF
ncbi:unnamed protein product [Tilletia controversa]|nr:unnamed protein product [Tilletia controversa]